MWLLLLHQIPPNPAYFRAKVMRRLNQLGALAIKNAAYLLPANDETVEDFEWLRREIVDGGGEAWLFRGDAVAPWSDAEIQDAFRRMRAPDYAALTDDLRAAADDGQRRKLQRRFEELKKIDFFHAPGRLELEAVMKEEAGFHARAWVTRQGVKVDRIASAWLIRRWLDPAARFRFVDPSAYRHTEGELRFDMFEGEFTHQGDLCTFEVLLRTLGREDAALAAVAEVVHDIDLKESKFGRPETPGVASLIEGIAARHADDARRIEAGSTIFDALYAQFGGAA
jgi:hypothetical protein